MVAQRGGEVDRPCPAEHADDEVAQAGHDLRANAIADLLRRARAAGELRQPDLAALVALLQAVADVLDPAPLDADELESVLAGRAAKAWPRRRADTQKARSMTWPVGGGGETRTPPGRGLGSRA